jgi:tetratricopeptide (TPR) repeat protein
MNREEALRDAERQRNQARVLTRLGDLPRAQKLLQNLTASLEMSLAEDEDEVRDEATSRAEVARALADAYGMLGGVEWRRGHLTEALTAYNCGRGIEQNKEFGISDSYNLVNAIVVSILRCPGDIDSLRDQIESAARVVGEQVQGERRDQWWAWADYALLTLLLGQEKVTKDAYSRFAECGPRWSDYQSVIRALQSLADALESVNAPTAKRLTDSIGVLGLREDAQS